jgi:RNA polymerase sigma-70 factor (ECF subfamily)
VTTVSAAGPDCASLDAPTGDERSLVLAAQRDRAAFAALYLRYASRIYAYLRTRTASTDEAADLTQQVFTNALAALDRYRVSAAPFSAWLFRIAINAATDLHRRRRSILPLEAALDISDGSNLEEQATRSDELRWLRVTVQGLSAAEQELLALRFAGGLTSREIAALVRRSEAAVKKQLWRTLRAPKEKHDATTHE